MARFRPEELARFRPTLWPDMSVSVPAVTAYEDVRRHADGWLELLGQPHEVDLPPDFYLQEMSAVRPTTPEAITEFVKTWGPASDPVERRDRPLRQLWMVKESAVSSGEARGERFLHVSEVVDRVEQMHWFARHIALMQEEDEQGVEQLGEDDWELFGEQLNAALSAFPIMVSLPSGMRPAVLPPLTAYSVAALQLFNDLAQRVPIRRCANEACPHGGLFTRQRGRAKVNQYHKTGVMYCSQACARSQAERERRRRKSGGN